MTVRGGAPNGFAKRELRILRSSRFANILALRSRNPLVVDSGTSGRKSGNRPHFLGESLCHIC